MAACLQAALREVLADDIAKFRQLAGMEFPQWSV